MKRSWLLHFPLLRLHPALALYPLVCVLPPCQETGSTLRLVALVVDAEVEVVAHAPATARPPAIPAGGWNGVPFVARTVRQAQAKMSWSDGSAELKWKFCLPLLVVFGSGMNLSNASAWAHAQP